MWLNLQYEIAREFKELQEAEEDAQDARIWVKLTKRMLFMREANRAWREGRKLKGQPIVRTEHDKQYVRDWHKRNKDKRKTVDITCACGVTFKSRADNAKRRTIRMCKSCACKAAYKGNQHGQKHREVPPMSYAGNSQAGLHVSVTDARGALTSQ